MSKRISTEQRKKQAEKIHDGKYNYSLWPDIVSNTIKVDIICPDHGIFNQSLANHVRGGVGCPLCANSSRNNNNRKSHEQALKELDARNKKVAPVYFYEGEQYISALQKYKFVCKNGHIWVSKFNDVTKGLHGCPKCAIKKREETCKLKYDCRHPTQRHIKGDHLKKMNKRWLKKQHIIKKRTLSDIGHELKVTVSAIGKMMHRHDIPVQHHGGFLSIPEKEIRDFIKELGIDFEENDRSLIPPHELDIYIPSHKLAIELNGIYWHSELNGKDRKYHLNKINTCKEKDIRLIHILETEWEFRPEIVKSRIKSTLGLNQRIFARNTQVVNVTRETRRLFFNENHIQGDVNATVSMGLIYEGELVSVMSFGKSRYSKKYEYEMLRFANKMGVTVVGGAGKLFKKFIKIYNPTSVISYSDKRWNTGTVYEKLGFDFKHSSAPNYFYFHISNARMLYPRIKFQKHKLKSQLETFDPQLTEWQNMVNNQYDRIWDCGNDVFVWTSQKYDR